MKKFLFILVVSLAWMLNLPVGAMDSRGRGRGGTQLSSSQSGRGSHYHSGQMYQQKPKVDSQRGGARGRGAKISEGSFGYDRKDDESFVIPTPSKVLAQSMSSHSKDAVSSMLQPSRSSMSCPSSSSTSFPSTSSDFPPLSSSSSGHSSTSSQAMADVINTCPLSISLHSTTHLQEWSAFSDGDDKGGEGLHEQSLHGRLDQLTLSGQSDFSRLPLVSSFPASSSSLSKMSRSSSDESSSDEESEDDLEKEAFVQRAEFTVTFKNAQEKLSILNCSDFHFCDFMKKAAALMASPQEVSLIRCYGFGLGHVPLLLVWSGHLHDRLTKSRAYCIKTNDLVDILSLMLIVDLQAQVDAACIEKLKKNLKSGGSFAVDVHGSVFEQSKTAPDAARYLKSKLFSLWEPIIVDLYGKKKLPKYRTILERVEEITQSWNVENHPSPLWVCCPQTARGMTVANWWGAWPSDRFGNWWDPQKELIEACRIFEEEQNYHDVIQQQISTVLREFGRNKTWLGYFGDLCSLEDIRGEEYDSEGGF